MHKAGHLLRSCSQPPGLCQASSEPLRNQNKKHNDPRRSPATLSSTYGRRRQGQKPASAAKGDPRTEVTAPGHRAAGDAGDAAVPAAAPGSAQGHPPRPPGRPLASHASLPRPSGTRLGPRPEPEPEPEPGPGGGQRTQAEPGRSGRRGPPDS